MMAMPNTSVALVTFEPMMLAVASPISPLVRAKNETISSGSEVPRATTVSEMKMVEMLS